MQRKFIAALAAAAGDAVFQFDQVHGQGSAVAHRMVEANGINLHIAEQGEGPLVVLCHGFPESWYSWRHQLTALWQPDSTPSVPICAVSVGPTDRRRSTSTPCCISWVTWWDCLTLVPDKP